MVFETGFGQNDISSEDIRCKAVECSPPPTFMWMIGRNPPVSPDLASLNSDIGQTRFWFTTATTPRVRTIPWRWTGGRITPPLKHSHSSKSSGKNTISLLINFFVNSGPSPGWTAEDFTVWSTIPPTTPVTAWRIGLPPFSSGSEVRSKQLSF